MSRPNPALRLRIVPLQLFDLFPSTLYVYKDVIPEPWQNASRITATYFYA